MKDTIGEIKDWKVVDLIDRKRLAEALEPEPLMGRTGLIGGGPLDTSEDLSENFLRFPRKLLTKGTKS